MLNFVPLAKITAQHNVVVSWRIQELPGDRFTRSAIIHIMRRSVPLPALCLTLAVCCFTGCSTTIEGRPQSGSDAASLNGFADGAQTSSAADAQVQSQPCVDGDRQASNAADGTCYMVFNGPLTWQAAQAQCISLGANLAIIESEAEQDMVSALAAGFVPGQPDLWLGASDLQSENSFVWVDSKPLVFSRWRSGEPNNQGANGTDEDCTVIEGDTLAREWDDRSCSSSCPSICERAPGNAP